MCVAAAVLAAGFSFSQTTGTDASKAAPKDKGKKAAKGAAPPAGVEENQPGVEAGREAKLETPTNLQVQVALLISSPIDSLKGAKPNQEYAATLDEPLMAGAQTIAPRGAKALLRISGTNEKELQLVALEVGGKMIRTDGSRLAPAEATRGIDLQPTYTASGARIQVPQGTHLSFTIPGTATEALAAAVRPGSKFGTVGVFGKKGAAPRPQAPPPAVSQAGWLLSVSGCGAEAGRSITCSLTLTNQGAERAAAVAKETTGYDAAGKSYKVRSSMVGRDVRSGAPVTVTFSKVGAGARIVRLEVVLSWGNAAAERATFSFAGVPEVGPR